MLCLGFNFDWGEQPFSFADAGGIRPLGGQTIVQPACSTEVKPRNVIKRTGGRLP